MLTNFTNFPLQRLKCLSNLHKFRKFCFLIQTIFIDDMFWLWIKENIKSIKENISQMKPHWNLFKIWWRIENLQQNRCRLSTTKSITTFEILSFENQVNKWCIDFLTCAYTQEHEIKIESLQIKSIIFFLSKVHFHFLPILSDCNLF